MDTLSSNSNSPIWFRVLHVMAIVFSIFLGFMGIFGEGVGFLGRIGLVGIPYPILKGTLNYIATGRFTLP